MKPVSCIRTAHSVLSAAVLIISPRVFATEITVGVIRDPAIAVQPVVYNNMVVYEDFSSGRYRFVSYALLSGSQKELSDNGAAYHYPYDFGGDVVGWLEYKTGYGGGGMPKSQGPIPIPLDAEYYVKVLNVSSGTVSSVAQSTGYKECLAADGDRVAWTDYRHFSAGDTTVEIYLYDISAGSETRLTSHAGYKANVDIQGNRAVWQDYRSKATTGINADIYMCAVTGGQETPVCTDGSYQDQPSLYGDIIVWQDYRNAGSGGKNADIFMRNMSSGVETAICTNAAYQEHPEVYGNYVVWQDYRNVTQSDTGNADIYMYDLATQSEQAITTRAGYQGPPSIHGNKVVWYDYTDKKIYLAQIGTADNIQKRFVRRPARLAAGEAHGEIRYDIRGREIGGRNVTGVQVVLEHRRGAATCRREIGVRIK